MGICCFKGYRPFCLPFGEDEVNPKGIELKAVIRRTVEKVIDKGFTYFICGFDLGADMIFAEILVGLKSEHPEVRLESAIPYENHAAKWPENQRERYFNLLAKCDIETMLQTHYTADCNIRCSKYMVGKSDILITVYNGKLSRAMVTVNYATQLGKKVICIDPETLTVTENGTGIALN